jgi:hypothetical protein
MLKQPLMRAVTQEKDIAALLLAKPQVTPPLGYDGAYADFSDGSEDKLSQPLRIVNNNASKSDVDRRRPSLQECIQLRLWGVLGSISKEESTDI